MRRPNGLFKSILVAKALNSTIVGVAIELLAAISQELLLIYLHVNFQESIKGLHIRISKLSKDTLKCKPSETLHKHKLKIYVLST